LTSVDEKKDMYKNQFKHLREAFQGYAILQTEIVVTRILDLATESGQFGVFMCIRPVNASNIAVSALELNDLPYQRVYGSRVHLTACLVRAKASWKRSDLL